MSVYKAIGEKLKEVREKNGYTQTEVEKAIGIKRELLSYYENGRREIDIATLEKLASFYGYSIEYFIKNIEEHDIVLAFRTDGLTEEDIEVVGWAKNFVNNLYQMEKLLEKRYGRVNA
ncbi:helix-turn-helix transcriptional regulator [Thermoanaerobacterium sp. CMT5567-10]|uniref:helix-turn-helix domain-containing protein n=1 Tax=Thermoanaerobacterium sp. CMT5567-10 TaxID=3061989 RepID=UPI0026DF5811|nr:helix-turn-helix transcriptional regulator [Thermoanaerobacterium sp. CMT5567-10]WKV09424.1 helix-turn-helix transcriptional regulator [Thermoanaerobacterium sp. CMT5567-10]